jgi:hypothetical protein
VWVTFVVRGSTREIATVALKDSPPPLPTQTAPAPAAMSLGIPPIEKRRTTSWVSGSIFVTVRSSVFSAQIAPSPTATLLGGDGASVSDAKRPVAPSNEAIPLAFDGAGASLSRLNAIAVTATAAAATTTAPAIAAVRRMRLGRAGTAGCAPKPSAPCAAATSSAQVA